MEAIPVFDFISNSIHGDIDTRIGAGVQMTLVIGVSTSRWVAIAADRMLSVGSKPVKHTATKLVTFYNDLMFGYTGAANLLNKSNRWQFTDAWLVDVLSTITTRNVGEVIAIIADEASNAIDRLRRTLPNSPPFKLAFLGVGWDVNAVYGKVLPVRCLISNFHYPNGERLDAPQSRFIAVSQVGFDDDLLVRDGVGCQQTRDEMQWLTGRLQQVIEAGYGGEAILNCMKESIRQTSRRLNNQYVGQDILAAIIPRNARLQERVEIMDPKGECGIIFTEGFCPRFHNVEGASFFMRFPKGIDDGSYESPHAVCPSLRELTMWARVRGKENVTIALTNVRVPNKAGLALNFKVNRPIGAKKKRRR